MHHCLEYSGEKECPSGVSEVLDRRRTALAAEILSEKLLEVYRAKQVQESIAQFADAGFSRTSLGQSADHLFRMIVLAAYDRRPFTQAAGGFEAIWGMNGRTGLAGELESAGIWSRESVCSMSAPSLDSVLKGIRIGAHALDAIEHVQYARTFLSAADVASRLRSQLMAAQTAVDVRKAYDTFLEVHGIGATIASKLVKYTLREIGMGGVRSEDFPLDVVWPLMDEYHVQQASMLLESGLGRDVVPLTAGHLLRSGEPCAIDALFYLDRYDPKWLRDFVDDLNRSWRGVEGAPAVPVGRLAGHDADEACRQILAVVRDVCEDIKGLSDRELRRFGTSVAALRSSAAKLLVGMQEHATRRSVEDMYRYYVNCLNSDAKLWDWVLEQVGRKSLKSEFHRVEEVIAAFRGVSHEGTT